MSTTTDRESSSERLDGLVYALTGLTAALGFILTLHPMLPPIPAPDLVVWGTGLVIAPATVVLLGYTSRSFWTAVFLGSLPGCGLSFGAFLREYTLRGLESAIAGAFTFAILVLPVSGVLYIVGVALRRDGTLTARKRGLAVRLLACTALGIVLYLVQAIGLVTRISDHML